MRLTISDVFLGLTVLIAGMGVYAFFAFYCIFSGIIKTQETNEKALGSICATYYEKTIPDASICKEGYLQKVSFDKGKYEITCRCP
jgi:hypothetical protein